MLFSLSYVMPAILGFCAGILPPIIIEKWKGRKIEKQKLSSLENGISNLQNSLQEALSRLSITEEKVRALEINLSHNTGVLKGQNADIPLEDTTNNLQTSFAAKV